MQAKIAEFPQEIHVTHEIDGDMDYLTVSDGKTAEDALTSTHTTRVAIYRLVEVKEGKLEPVFSAIVG